MLSQSTNIDIQWLPNGFNYPWVLWLWLIPMLMIIWIWQRRSRGVVIPVDHSVHGDGFGTRLMIGMAEMMAPLILVIVIWLLAGPLLLGKPTEKRALTNIQFCVDVSGSMTAEFGEGSRYDASMRAIDQFLDFREGDAFGLTFFGNTVLHWCPLTTDSSAIRCSPPFMRPEVLPHWFGGTSIGAALLACRRELMQAEVGDRMIILVSDGESGDISGEAGVEIADRLKTEEITVYAIHVAEGEVPEDILNITSVTGGEVFNPGDEESLIDVFARIDQMEKAQVEQSIAEQLDHFKPYAAIGVSLLGLLTLCGFGLRYTPW